MREGLGLREPANRCGIGTRGACECCHLTFFLPSTSFASTRRGRAFSLTAVVAFSVFGEPLRGVLIVDDHPLVRSFLRSALEAAARVFEAADVERALEILEERAGDTVNLVLVDYVLPGRSGLDLLRVIKRRWPWISVVVLTGFGSEELAVEVFREGASDYLKKPVEVDALMRAVAAALPRTDGPQWPARHDDAHSATAHPRHPSIDRALVFMREHFAEPISLIRAAGEAGLSRFHFCRLFHSETGKPFHEYLQDLRVRQATALLANRYLRVSEIAYAVGFNDLSHFDRTFHKILGQSPTAYRASLRRQGMLAGRRPVSERTLFFALSMMNILAAA